MSSIGGLDTVLSTTTASDNAAGLIRGMIFSGELGPEARLPSGSDLAAKLGISVVTLRVALKSLETSGYIVTSVGAHGGSRVSDLPALTKCWDDWLVENLPDVEDIFELRMTIETRVAWLAAERRTDDDLEELEEANALLAGPDSLVVPWNSSFHGALAQAAHSRHLARVMVDVQRRLFLPVHINQYEYRNAELRAPHATILEAVRHRAPQAAAENMRSHLADTLDMFRRHVEQTR